MRATAGEAGGAAPFSLDGGAPRGVLRPLGRWVTEELTGIEAALQRLAPGSVTAIDLGGLEALDSNGAWLIERTRLAHGGAPVTGGTPEQAALLETVAKATARGEVPVHALRLPPFFAFLDHIGRASAAVGEEALRQINFLGALSIAVWGTILRPWRLRAKAMVVQIERTGFDALPIVGLLSFLVGVVIAYQGADQLKRFGAQIYTVNIVGIGELREMGILIAAIIVAGRSGSAFTAQIGTMRVNQEVDALEALGISPLEMLAVPRVLALVVVMPLLTFYSDVAGVLGGAVMSALTLDISLRQFVAQFQQAVPVSALIVGLVKAPLFGFVIAFVGCYQGLMVSRSAESVGRRTTQAVVESIFLVIVLDAMFSILFSVLGL